MAIDVFFFFHRVPLTCSNSKQPRRDAAAYFMDTVWMVGAREDKSEAVGADGWFGWGRGGGRGEVGGGLG